MQLLALQVGLSTVQAVELDAATAKPLGPVAELPFELHQPTPEAVEVPVEDIWSTVTVAAREACRDFPSVEGIGLVVAAPFLVLLDKADQPLAPVRTPLDRRARPAARQCWAAVGDELLATTGNRPLPGGVSVVSYRQQLSDDPYLCHRVRSVLHLNGWLAQRICGERAIDPANASLTGLFGTLTDRQWSQRWCDYFEVNRDWLPPVVDGTTTVGTVRAAAAAELGVTAGIPLKLGTVEINSAMLAAGMATADLLHIVSPIQTLAAIVSQPKPSRHLLTHLLGVGDACIQVAYNPVGAAAIDWIKNLCFRDQDDAEFYKRTLPAACQRSSLELLDPPALAGDPLEIEGYRAAFRDLTLTTDRLDLLASVVQAMRRGHGKALEAVGKGGAWRRVLFCGAGQDVVRKLLPEYSTAPIAIAERGALRGVAKLFEG